MSHQGRGGFYDKDNDCGSQLSCQPASRTEEKGEVNTVCKVMGREQQSNPSEKHDEETLETVRLGQMSMRD